MKNKKCLLEERCCDGKCVGCGWDSEEAERRKKEFAENGLTLCNDGLHRLVIKRGHEHGST
jgi:hypothetical protein